MKYNRKVQEAIRIQNNIFKRRHRVDTFLRILNTMFGNNEKIFFYCATILIIFCSIQIGSCYSKDRIADLEIAIQQKETSDMMTRRGYEEWQVPNTEIVIWKKTQCSPWDTMAPTPPTDLVIQDMG